MDFVRHVYCWLRSVSESTVTVLRCRRQAVDFVRERLQQGEPPRAVCAALCDHCLAPNTEGCGKGCGERPELPCVSCAWAAAVQCACRCPGISGMRYRIHVSTEQTPGCFRGETLLLGVVLFI